MKFDYAHHTRKVITMEEIVKAILVLLIIIFFIFQTANWFILQAYRIKLNFQKNPVTQMQAERLLKQIRFIYFWLMSSYYTSRMKEIYYLAYNSPEVEVETVEKLRRSIGRRMVRGLPKLQVNNRVR